MGIPQHAVMRQSLFMPRLRCTVALEGEQHCRRTAALGIEELGVWGWQQKGVHVAGWQH